MITADQVKAALNKESTKGRSTLNSLAILILTLLLFVSVGFFQFSLSAIATIVVVLLVHEFGHYLGMKYFGYRDVTMFFVPFLGAAVSGDDPNPTGTRKAIVALLGPLPGIIVGIVCAVLAIKNENTLLADFARASLFINGFNLLPLYPLDGGKFLEFVLFARRPRLELAFKVLTTVALIAIAVSLEAVALGLFALLVVLSLRGGYDVAKTAQKIRADIPEATLIRPNDIPDVHLEKITRLLHDTPISKTNNPSLVARHVRAIWQRVCNRSPSTRAAIALLVVYALTLPIGIASPFIFEVANGAEEEIQITIKEKTGPDGKKETYEVRTLRGSVFFEARLDSEGFFDGPALAWYHNQQKKSEGQWSHGYWHGKFTFWNKAGQVTEVVIYEEGNPKTLLVPSNGVMAEVPPSDWPTSLASQSSPPSRSPAFSVREGSRRTD